MRSSRFSSVVILRPAGPLDQAMVKAPSASTLANSEPARVAVVTLPLPLMPVTWQPPSARAAKVNSFAAAKGRIVMVFIGILSLLNEMRSQAGLDSKNWGIYRGLRGLLGWEGPGFGAPKAFLISVIRVIRG